MKTFLKITRHIKTVQSAMGLVIDDLISRSENHDMSKLKEDEFGGYERFDSMPEYLEYGSEEYEEAKAQVMKDNNAVGLHYKRNDHHPEHFEDVNKMHFQQIIEMVCDWCSAHLEYGNKGSWQQGVEANIEKHKFTLEQKWLIRDVSMFLSSRIPQLQSEIKKD